jgi:hypothetical protein
VELLVVQDSEMREDWGEKHTGKQSPKVFVMDVVNKCIYKVPGQQDSSSYGQPLWSPEGGLIMVLSSPALPAFF